MELKSLLVDSKTTWVEFPGLLGFEVELANLSRKELVNLRKRCTQNKFNRKTRGFEEILDDDKFIVEYCKAVIKGWKGLKYKYLEKMLLLDVSSVDLEDELPYTQEDAEIMMKNASDFDTWVTEVVADLENFTSSK